MLALYREYIRSIMCIIFEADSTTYCESDLLNFDEFEPFSKIYTMGEFIKAEFPVMQLRRSRMPHDIFTYGPWLLVSKAFIKALNECGARECFQAFKADIILKKGKVTDSYFVLHLLRRVDCLDKEWNVLENK